SKRSTKSNAYFTGLGKRKRIVLFDTLIEEHSINELVAVLAHEIGHYKKKHILQTLLLSTIETGILLYLFSLLVNSPVLSEALGVSTPSFHIGLLVFGIIYRPLSMLLGILMNYISRKNEYEADRFSGENYDAGALRQALKKLSVNHLSNLRPHTAYVFVHYSHPPLLKRLDALEVLDQTGSKE
ncbi:MAG: M48 family metallopeptidase, partial [Bacteroidales bacterium]|nr:M48 family metallopeptidase [Bacteroidales bacterium]